jgi:hypothetical protein
MAFLVEARNNNQTTLPSPAEHQFTPLLLFRYGHHLGGFVILVLREPVSQKKNVESA